MGGPLGGQVSVERGCSLGVRYAGCRKNKEWVNLLEATV